MQAQQKQRLAWPDVAKGVSILGVVILHISLAVPGAQETWLTSLNNVIDPLRMPLFFLVSGFFSYKVFRYSLPQLFRRRLWYFIIPYIVWSAGELWTNSVLNHINFGDPIYSVRHVAVQLLLGHTMGWFLHALILFNVALWAVRKLPTPLALAASFTPVFFLPWADTYFFIGKALMYLPVFIGGAYLRRHIADFTAVGNRLIRWVAHPRQEALPGAGVAAFFVAGGLYALGYWVRSAWDARETVPEVPWYLPGPDTLNAEQIKLVVRLVEQLLMAPVGLLGAVALAAVPLVSPALQFVGRHTLPVYLSHPIALDLSFGMLLAHSSLEIYPGGPWPVHATSFWVAVCIAVCAAGSVLLWAAGRVPVLRWTLKPPALEGRRASREPLVGAGNVDS